MNWLQRLQQRWQLRNTTQAFVILLVFACTGTTVALVAKPLLRYAFSPAEIPAWAYVTYYILILPIYNVVLLMYGALFGQFAFFWNFEKRFLKRIFGSKPSHDK